MISIIIPTYNEEKWLPYLLEDIKRQTFEDYEIIVADAFSKDKTREVARSYGARVVDGGMPAKGRNEGAKAAQGDFFIFFDADVRISKRFLEKAYKEFQKKYVELATCDYYPDSDRYTNMKALFDIYNTYARTVQFFLPYCMGVFIMMTRRLFYRLGGFDETITLGEDWDIANRGSKLARFRILETVKIKISVRRIIKEGKVNYLKKIIKSNLYQLFQGNIRDDKIVEYEFGHYDDLDRYKKDKSNFKENLKDIRDRFLKFNNNNKKKSKTRKKKTQK